MYYRNCTVQIRVQLVPDYGKMRRKRFIPFDEIFKYTILVRKADYMHGNISNSDENIASMLPLRIQK